jgi:uncharacterized membrane protein/thiol-disulfide isomerase/thioredoxin
MTKSKHLLSLLILLGLFFPWTQEAQAGTILESQEQPVVRVVMFWTSTCGHCEYVINEILPPLQEQYSDQLEILLIELVTQEDVDHLYETATIMGIPQNNVGVPFMLVGERVLSGSEQIPRELPGLIEMHLENGGLDYPRYPSLAGYLPAPIDSPTVSDEATNNESEADQLSTPIAVSEAHPGEDSAGSYSNGLTLALVVFVGMVIAIVYVIYALLRESEPDGSQRFTWLDWLIPILALAGIGVAGYLTYVETQAVEAICGPIGDCNSVQSSSYAKVFGILPVGILGLLGYVAILIAWVIQKVRHDRWASYAIIAMLGMALFGTLYSIYLTYIEIWVIRAVCMWCVSSAVLITLLMLLSVQPVVEALDSLGEDEYIED